MDIPAKHLLSISVIIIVLNTLTACGGGGGGGSSKKPPLTDGITGQFMGGEVTGVKYKASSGDEGVTDAGGYFIYRQNDTISFYIGGTRLGNTVTAKANMSPLDLVPDYAIPKTIKEVNFFWANIEKNSYPSELINIAALLYSADKDKDPRNGVTIPEALHQTWSSLNLDLSQNIIDFNENQLLRVKQYQAYNEGELDSARVIFPLQAFDYLAKNLDIESEVYAITQGKLDSNNDGDVNATIKLSLNKNNFVDDDSRYVYDDSGSKFLFQKSDTKTDIYGRNLVQDIYVSEGIIGLTTTWQYDIHGNALKITTGNAQTKEDLITSTFVYDENGNKLEEKRVELGEDFLFNKFTYDSNGNMLSEIRYEENELRLQAFHTYNSKNQRTQTEYDNDDNGQIEQIITFRYNSSGLQTHRLEDIDNNGAVDFSFENTYNSNGDVLSFVQKNSDGSLQINNTFAYDKQFNLIKTRRDTDADGIIDEKFDYQYNSSNFLTLKTSKLLDGTAKVETFKYDSNDNVIEQWVNVDGAGKLNVVKQTVDPMGLIIEARGDVDGNGDFEFINEYTNSKVTFFSKYIMPNNDIDDYQVLLTDFE